jgi:hypothetical protein
MAVDMAMMTSPPHTQFIDGLNGQLFHWFTFLFEPIQNSPNLNPLIQNKLQPMVHIIFSKLQSHTCSQQYSIISHKSQKIEIRHLMLHLESHHHIVDYIMLSSCIH